MHCREVIYHTYSTMTKGSSNQSRPEKESIHSGHFMVSHFEAEAQDDEDDLAVPLPDESETDTKVVSVVSGHTVCGIKNDEQLQQQISIETSLNKLFQCMSLAYRQKLTSPKWNRFKGIKLRWKDKIRLNNVIWRCWHMQFILKQNPLVCQFASPLDVDTHIKPEATILEGKYWKRKAEAVTAEYKKWRMFYRNKTLGLGIKDVSDVICDMDILDWQSPGDGLHMLVDEDYISFMSDTLFSTITSNQPFAFPDTREIARGASLADFIQPSLGPLQPNLDDFMDTIEPLQEFLSGPKLAPVPEEIPDDNMYKVTIPPSFMDQNLQQALHQQTVQFQNTQMQPNHISQQMSSHSHLPTESNNHMMLQGSITRDPTLNQNSCIDRQHSQHSTNMMSRHNYLPQTTIQNNNQTNTNSSMLQQQQNMMMQQQPTYNVPQSNIVSQQQQNVMASGPVVQPQQQNILTVQNNQQQQQLQKQTPSYMQQNQKMYGAQQLPAPSYQDNRNFNTRQVQQQSPNENNIFGGRIRTNSAGGGGYCTDRRSRPIAPAPPPNFAQFMGGTSQSMGNKPLYNEQCLDRGMHSSQQNQQMKGQMFIGTQMNDIVANLSVGNNARFKMPSPPPQMVASSQLRVPQNTQQHKKKQIKQENFRSNSLPLGVTLASVMGMTSSSNNSTSGGAGNSSGDRQGISDHRASNTRRPRSGSSSPAPAQRRATPAPLTATASEPLLKETSVLLAHLLNAKGQNFFKPSSVQSIPNEVQQTANQPHPIALIQSPLVNQMPTTIVTTTSKLIPFGSNSPTSLPSPQSPLSPAGESRGSGGEYRRTGHIHAEQKRRYNIKNGFDLLQSLIPKQSQNPNSKVSKAAMLQRGADYIKQLQAERTIMKEEIDALKQQIETLNNSLSNCQSLLPATGVIVSRQRSGKLKEMFDDYVKERTRENWKFWVFSLLVEPLLHSFNSSVSPASTDELKRSTYLWAEQHCSLVEMRPAALTGLRTLSTITEVLRDPEKLPEEALAAVERNKKDP